MGLCEKCECNGHATECDKEYGSCINCQHNTEGDQCERCNPGFEGDAIRGTCQSKQEPARPTCQCFNHSPRGCDSFERCLVIIFVVFIKYFFFFSYASIIRKDIIVRVVKRAFTEMRLEPLHTIVLLVHARKIFFKWYIKKFKCFRGTSDCFLDNGGQVQCRNCPAGFSGRLCDE